jgi:hypothetical protein
MERPLYIDSEGLLDKIDKSGLKIKYLCEKIGISRTAFNKKVQGKTPFRASEIYVLQDLCRITDKEALKIFYPEGTQK